MKPHWQPCRRPSIRGVRKCCLSSQEPQEPDLFTSICSHCTSHQATPVTASQYMSPYPGQITHARSSDKCLEVRQARQAGNDSHTASDSSSMSSSLELTTYINLRSRKQHASTKDSGLAKHGMDLHQTGAVTWMLSPCLDTQKVS